MANVSSSNGLEKRPKLRFPGFDEPWKETTLSALFSKSTQKNTDGHITNVICNSARLGLIPQREYFDKDIANSDNTSGYYIIRQNDFVYNPRKSSDAPYGPISSYKYAEDGIVSPLYLCFHAKGEINPLYYEWYFRSSAWHRYIYMSGDSGARHDRVSIKDDTFFAMPINLPSEQEQSKIASFLQSLDERIAAQERLVASIKKHKRGVVSKVFSEIERECSTIRLGDYVSIHRGGSPRPIDAYITDDTDGINWIKIGDTSADDLYITRTREKIVPSGAKKSRRVFQGDLILSNSMSFGRPYILQIDGCIHDGWLLIRDENNVFEKRFLCYYLGSDNVIAQYKRFAAGSCVNNLNSELVGNVEICCPPYRTQQKIANMLTVLDSRIDHASRTHVALLRIRTSLLQQLFI